MEFVKLVQSFSSPLLDVFFSIITYLGDENLFILIFCLVYWCINKKFAYIMGFAFLSNGILNTALKGIFKVPRLSPKQGIRTIKINMEGYSFPSGHAQSAASYWTSLMLKIRGNWFYITGILVILLVGLSRIYLGLHTLKDDFI